MVQMFEGKTRRSSAGGSVGTTQLNRPASWHARYADGICLNRRPYKEPLLALGGVFRPVALLRSEKTEARGRAVTSFMHCSQLTEKLG